MRQTGESAAVSVATPKADNYFTEAFFFYQSFTPAVNILNLQVPCTQ